MGAVVETTPCIGWGCAPVRCVGPDLNRRTSTGQRPQRCAVGLAWLPTLAWFRFVFRIRSYPRVTKRAVDFPARWESHSFASWRIDAPTTDVLARNLKRRCSRDSAVKPPAGGDACPNSRSAKAPHGGVKTELFYFGHPYARMRSDERGHTRSGSVVRPIILPSHGNDLGSNPSRSILFPTPSCGSGL